MLRLLTTLYLLGSMVLMIATIGFLAWESVTRWPIPHVGYQPRYALLALVPTIFAAIAPWFREGCLSRLARLIWLALLLSIVIVDQFNLLLNYEIWIYRGMPSSGLPPWEMEYVEGRNFLQEWQW